MVIIGGGFGGVFTAKHLRRLAPPNVHIELISRNNFMVFQPLLPEVASGSIHPVDAVSPLRVFLPNVAVRVAEVRKLDIAGKAVHVTSGPDGEIDVIRYDQLVVALGQVTDLSLTPGLADRALVMKDVVDAFHIRNRVISCLEAADVCQDARRKRRLLTFVVVGGGFTGVETVGELRELIHKSRRRYPSIRRDEINVVLIQHGARILPELPEHLAAYADENLRRRGIEILLQTGVTQITAGGLETDSGRTIDAGTIIAAIGNAPSPLLQVSALPLAHGRIVVDRCLRVHGLTDVWALGDCARIPLGDPSSPAPPYAPALAQFAVREAHALARNIAANLDGRALQPFAYRQLGSMASLGARSGVADILGVRVTGAVAWMAWRAFYLGMLPGLSTRIRVAIDWLMEVFVSRNIVEIRPTQVESRTVRLLAGDLILEPGVDPAGVYVVTSGSIEVTTFAAADAGDEPLSRTLLGPGDCFGVPIDGKTPPPPQQARAAEESTAYFVARHDLERLTMIAALLDTRNGTLPATPTEAA